MSEEMFEQIVAGVLFFVVVGLYAYLEIVA